jgi:hypothetical protein
MNKLSSRKEKNGFSRKVRNIDSDNLIITFEARGDKGAILAWLGISQKKGCCL